MANPSTSTPRPRLAREGLCNAFARDHPATSVKGLRYHNVYGPRMERNTRTRASPASSAAPTNAARARSVLDMAKRSDSTVHPLLTHVRLTKASGISAMTDRRRFLGHPDRTIHWQFHRPDRNVIPAKVLASNSKH